MGPPECPTHRNPPQPHVAKAASETPKTLDEMGGKSWADAARFRKAMLHSDNNACKTTLHTLLHFHYTSIALPLHFHYTSITLLIHLSTLYHCRLCVLSPHLLELLGCTHHRRAKRLKCSHVVPDAFNLRHSPHGGLRHNPHGGTATEGRYPANQR